MIKLVLFLAVCCYAASAEEYTLDTCKCGEGYQPQADTSGKVTCGGIYLAHQKPCDLPDQPKCVCTQEKVTAIQKDQDGTWCLPSDGEHKRWACENKDEWEKYKVDLDAYNKKHNIAN